ncbi:hypothetical protein Tco_0307132 [Tanacetum coccineum]
MYARIQGLVSKINGTQVRNLKGLVSNFMASQDARISKFEADFKQYQSEMTNKIDTFWKAMNDRMTGALPSDTFKNVKLNVNHTSSVLSACSYPTGDPQSSSNSFKSVNAIKTCFKPTTNIQKYQLQVSTLTVEEVKTPKSKEPKKALEDEFRDSPLSLPVLEILAPIPIYDALLDKYIESLEGFLATVGSIIDHRKAKIAVGKGITSSIFGVKEIDFGEENIPYWTTIGKHESYTPKTSKDGIGARSPYYAKKDFWDNHLPGVIFNEKKLESSYDFQVDDSWMTI